MADKVVNLKVFHKGDARRLTIDEAVCTNFVFVKEKLQVTFPTLRGASFKVTWKDADGDDITISSDEDLITAFTEMNGNIKVLHVISSENSAGEEFNFKQFFNEAGANNAKNQGCPFSANGFDAKDVQSLGAMARQYLGPFLETMNAQAQSAGGSNKMQESQLMNLIRNAAEGFLGNIPADKQNQSNQPTNSNTEAKPSTSTTSTGSTENTKTTSQAGSSPNSNAASSSAAHNKAMAEALAQLQQMGFKNDNGVLTHLLECFNGNIPSVVKALAEM